MGVNGICVSGYRRSYPFIRGLKSEMEMEAQISLM